jgi:hypothetical protein
MGAKGYVDEFNRYSVIGWAGDPERISEPVSLTIFLNNKEAGQFKTSLPRDGLGSVGLAPTGPYGFRYYFDPPLSPFHRFEVRIETECGVILGPGQLKLDASPARPATNIYRPRGAAILTTTGRTGSTLLMKVFAANPLIVVAARPPYEMKLVSYYAYLFRNMIARGDHIKSLTPENVTHASNRFQIGLNPYFEAGYRANFRAPDIFDRFVAEDLPTRVAPCLEGIVLDYYAAVAQDTGKPNPILFVEKVLGEIEVREGARYLFPGLKEIVQVRDPRDLYCSALAFDRYSNVAEAQRMIAEYARDLLRYRRGHDSSMHFLKYEDLVLDRAETLAQLYAFLGVPQAIKESTAGESELFGRHGTSASPEKSIGRWKTETSIDFSWMSGIMDDFIAAFGYEPGLPNQGHVGAVAAGERAAPRPSHLPDDDLMSSFESLGENCEFGLVQRQCGVEPIGLLRFASAPLPKLLKALHARFAGLGEAANVHVELSSNGREYMILDRQYGFYTHAWVLANEATASEVHAREVRRIPLLRRKLIEDLEAGEKIFVFHGMAPLKLDEARQLLVAIRSYGPGTLLWVEIAEQPENSGTVAWVEPGLMKGQIDRFAPGENAHDLSLECWRRLCRSALKLQPKPVLGGVKHAAESVASSPSREETGSWLPKPGAERAGKLL